MSTGKPIFVCLEKDREEEGGKGGSIYNTIVIYPILIIIVGYYSHS